MMQHSKFLTNSKPSAGATTHVSFSQDEKLASRPELFWAFTILLNQSSLVDIAWRKATYDKKQVSTLEKDEATENPSYNKNKFTGSPAFKELKNLIVAILSSNIGNDKTATKS